MWRKIFSGLMVVTMLLGATALVTGCDANPGKEIDLSQTEGED